MDKHNVSDSSRIGQLRLQACRGAVAVCVTALLFSFFPFERAEGEVFDSKYLRFRLPDGWKCHLEDDVFICQPPLPKGHKWPTIIVLAAKIASEHDTLTDYTAHLRGNLSKGKDSSLVEAPRINNDLGKVSWVEATHFGSEVPDFYTTYLATTWEGLSILVTFSAHKSVFPKFREMIEPCIQSLQVKSDWKIHTSAR